MQRSMLHKFLRDHYLKPKPCSIPDHLKDRALVSTTPPHSRHTTHTPLPLPHRQTTRADRA